MAEATTPVASPSPAGMPADVLAATPAPPSPAAPPPAASQIVPPEPPELPGGPDGPDGPSRPVNFDRQEPPHEHIPPGVPLGRSSYMDYLPGIYSRNEFLGRYLLIFESILSPIQRTIANAPFYFDPGTTPASLLPWLGAWLGLVMDERWPEDRRRDLIAAASRLYRWRGTRRGMVEVVRIFTGVEPEIIEPTLTEISANRNRAFRFTVRVTLPRGADADERMLQRIIDLEKPAFAAGTVEIRHQ